jgi:hypothetical protein
MVQMDGSHHDWFEGRSGKCVLMVMIDDATSQSYARFYPAETTDAAFDVMGRWVKKRGLPRSLYVDGHSIYRDEDHPDHPTQFGRACKQLGVELIRAHSPQAKGRVERRNAVFQDRLVKELRLRGISDMAQANDFLDGRICTGHWRRTWCWKKYYVRGNNAWWAMTGVCGGGAAGCKSTSNMAD